MPGTAVEHDRAGRGDRDRAGGEDGVDAYKVIHICYGQQEGQPGVTELRGGKLFPWLWDLNCDQIQYEMCSHGFDQSDIDAIGTIPDDKDFGVGVVNGKSLVAESPEQVAHGIRRVLEVVGRVAGRAHWHGG